MEGIVKYLFEAGMLKRVARSGWWTEGIKNPETVAEHSFRAAIISFVIAKMEGESDESAQKIATAAIFHDLHETRLLDLNKISARYLDVSKSKQKEVEKEQMIDLPKEISASISKILNLTDNQLLILKDSDYLECAITAKEYSDLGVSGTKKWVISISQRLKTKSAKSLIKLVSKLDSNSWTLGLKVFKD